VIGHTFRALVTGADEHQGLAVIRGLGLGGVEVVAAGAGPRCLGHRSKFATWKYEYASPSAEPARFVEDIIAIARETRPSVIVPSVETTLVLLNQARERVEAIAPLAAPAPEILEYALDKSRTVALAERLGVPVPRTAMGQTTEELLRGATSLTFPVAVKPRGNRFHASTANAVPFKSTYANTYAELMEILAPLGDDAGAILVQEFATGTGRCVAAVCRHGEPMELFAYARDREYPLSGGVSVVRRSIPLDAVLADHTTRLLTAIRWHGVAMVEFKHDEVTGRHVLMEINGRFQASTALSLDSGINLPLLAASLFAGWTPPHAARYRTGVTERWLRGDLLALRAALTTRHDPAPGRKVARAAVVRQFFTDFRRDVRFDEFWVSDPGPAAAEAGAIARMLLTWCVDAAKAVVRAIIPSSIRSRATTLRQGGSQTPAPSQTR
jgi:predicted ATP-grasp superfamily ATP-dependent carboligase